MQIARSVRSGLPPHPRRRDQNGNMRRNRKSRDPFERRSKGALLNSMVIRRRCREGRRVCLLQYSRALADTCQDCAFSYSCITSSHILYKLKPHYTSCCKIPRHRRSSDLNYVASGDNMKLFSIVVAALFVSQACAQVAALRAHIVSCSG